MAGIVLLFLFLLNHYVFANTKPTVVTELVLDHTVAQAAIQQLELKPATPVTAIMPEMVNPAPSTEAMKAPISVYHREPEAPNAQAAPPISLNNTWQPSHSPFELKAGTLIPAILQTQIDSDLPGMITAKIRRDVFDTKTGNYLLLPQGTTLIGRYQSQIAYGQERILIAWSRMIFPDASSQDLGDQPGVDVSGQSGLQDEVNHHFLRVFGASTMISSLAALGQLSQPRSPDSALALAFGSMGQQWTQTGTQLVDKNLAIQPTIVIRSGTLFNVILQKDLALPHSYSGRQG